MTARLQRSAGGVPLSLWRGVGQATCSEGGQDIASNSDLEGDRVTDLCGTTRFGGQVCPLLSLATCPNSELRRRTIGSSTGPRRVR